MLAVRTGQRPKSPHRCQQGTTNVKADEQKSNMLKLRREELGLPHIGTKHEHESLLSPNHKSNTSALALTTPVITTTPKHQLMLDDDYEVDAAKTEEPLIILCLVSDLQAITLWFLFLDDVNGWILMTWSEKALLPAATFATEDPDAEAKGTVVSAWAPCLLSGLLVHCLLIPGVDKCDCSDSRHLSSNSSPSPISKWCDKSTSPLWLLQNLQFQPIHKKTSGKPTLRDVLQNTAQYSSKASRS
nr:unnamed protein product [Camelus bactrianus]